jgi:GNAT superfamily N-acetyltransferase
MRFCLVGAGAKVESDLRSITEIRAAAAPLDEPGQPPIGYEMLAQQYARREAGPVRHSLWVARAASVGGRPIPDGVAGYAWLALPRMENVHAVYIDIVVRPELRRLDVGTGFLRVLAATATAEGRTHVFGVARSDGPGAAWATRVGFTRVHGYIQQKLVLADVDPALWNVPTAAGFRLERWIGATPEDLLDSFAQARQAMSDAPRGESSMDAPDWTPERVRQYNEQIAARNVEQRVVVAVQEADGRVAGLTELYVERTKPEGARQQDTAVLKEFRGLGLGRAMKAAMLRWLVEDQAGVERITTQTAVDNPHMARVSREVGFQDLWREDHLEAAIGGLKLPISDATGSATG